MQLRTHHIRVNKMRLILEAGLLLLLSGSASFSSSSEVKKATGNGKGAKVNAAAIRQNGGPLTWEGSQTSFAQYKQWYGGPNDSLSFDFKTDMKDALLLYSDNRAEREYIQLRLVTGTVVLRCNWGRGGQLIALNLTDPAAGSGEPTWHHVNVIKNGPETTLVVDRAQRTVRANGGGSGSRSSFLGSSSKQFGPRKDGDTRLAFGDPSSNSYVFVGGLPVWHGEQLDSLVLPTTILEPRLRGSVRNLKYRDTRSATDSVQKIMAYKVCDNLFHLLNLKYGMVVIQKHYSHENTLQALNPQTPSFIHSPCFP